MDDNRVNKKKKKKEKKDIHRTSIGGQAVIDGVMMRGVDKTCIAVRSPEGEIVIEQLQSDDRYKTLKKIPVVRGVVNFLSSLSLGFRAINRSAQISMTPQQQEEETSKLDKYLEKKFGEKASAVITGISVVFAVALAVGLFIILPFYFARAIEWIFSARLGFWFNLVEGVIRITVFVLYIALVGRIGEIKRLFRYHGAEHKAIHCYEHDMPRTVENIEGYSTLHKRCGTNFLLIVMVVSILVFSFLNVGNPLLRIALRLLLLPIVAGVAYEIIKIAGRYDNWFTALISAPGLLLQRLTTSEPDSGQIEVAGAVLDAVLTDDRERDRW